MFHKLHSPDPVVLETGKPFKNAKSHFSDTLYHDFGNFALYDSFKVQVQKERVGQKLLTGWPYRIKDHIVLWYPRYFFFKVSPLYFRIRWPGKIELSKRMDVQKERLHCISVSTEGMQYVWWHEYMPLFAKSNFIFQEGKMQVTYLYFTLTFLTL